MPEEYDMSSILISIKKLLGIEPSYTQFDPDIVLYINTVLSTIYQLGLGTQGYSITDDTDLWSDFLGDFTDLEMVKSYVLIKVRLLFDPPTNSTLLQAFERMANELEWRLTLQVEGEESGA